MEEFQFKIFVYVVILLSAVFHEYAHGWMAYRLGDPTAKNMGRLTLNPLAHIDPIGTVVLPLILLLSPIGIFLGWAKPVPYNPYLLRDPKYGSLKVGIAGPVTNLIIAIILGVLLRLYFLGVPLVSSIPGEIINLIAYIVFINIILALFNMIPLPPLDGSKVMADLFPRQWEKVMRLGFAGILIALFIAFYLLGPLSNIVFWIITGASF